MISWLLPVTVAGLLFKFMFASKGGIINQLFMSLHLINAPLEWLLDPKLAMIAIVVANIWIGIPFNMMLLITDTVPDHDPHDKAGYHVCADAGICIYIQSVRPGMGHDKGRAGQCHRAGFNLCLQAVL